VPEERRRLRVKDPEQYHWHPRKLIAQLAEIHLALYRARRDEWVQVGAVVKAPLLSEQMSKFDAGEMLGDGA
jgi:hypothetical protein